LNPKGFYVIWDYLIDGPWIVFAAYWAIGALKTRRTAKKESFTARYSIMTIEIVGFYLLLSGDAAIGFLGRRVLLRTLELRVFGVVLLWAGIALALWARWHLGQYWSGRITIKEGHKLIRTGPYARLRHPIYSGLVLAVIGTAIEVDQWRGIAAVCIVLLGFWIKGRREETLLTKQFGAEFEEHLRATGFLLPKL
jgi:protein-S-isoprenylcysteine O-methyltransferase Ste14